MLNRTKVQTLFFSYIIKPGRYYFLPSLNFLALSFKREGAKEASFLEVKIFFEAAYFKVGKK